MFWDSHKTVQELFFFFFLNVLPSYVNKTDKKTGERLAFPLIVFFLPSPEEMAGFASLMRVHVQVQKGGALQLCIQCKGMHSLSGGSNVHKETPVF